MPSIVDKYSEQAHFIYELLQNADDACATSAKFILTQQHLIFIHDGKRHFSISDPATEDEDRANGKLGDINAITAIGLSTKTTDATIGKFGVGFKSVFQYTRSPHIYDSNCNFKIEDYVVPRLIDDDMSDLYGRRNDETMFCLPFNPDGDGAQTAYEDIAFKLRNLNHPLLFLQHLQTVSYECDDFKGSYTKQLEKSYAFGDTTAEHILLHDVVELFDDEDDYVDDDDECVYEEDGETMNQIRSSRSGFSRAKQTKDTAIASVSLPTAMAIYSQPHIFLHSAFSRRKSRQISTSSSTLHSNSPIAARALKAETNTTTK